MRGVRWLAILLCMSVLANVTLVANWMIGTVDRGHWQSDVESSFRILRAEADSLRSLRSAVCPPDAPRDRAAIAEWALGRNDRDLGDEDAGFVWHDGIGVGFGEAGTAETVCLPMTWQITTRNRPTSSPDEDDFAYCERQPLC